MVLDYERNENIMKVSINSIIGFSIKIKRIKNNLMGL